MNCEFFNCENARRTGNLCATHYQQKKRGYAETPVDHTEHQACAVSHCSISATTRAEGSYCSAHYQMQYRGVDPETRKARLSGKSDATCWVKECLKGVKSKGLCNYHARRARGGMLEVPEELGVKLNAPCSFEGCGRAYITKGLCHSHYLQLQSGRGLSELRDWGRYTKGEHICSLPNCRRVAVSTGLCDNHKSAQMKYKISVAEMNEIWANPECANPGCENTTHLRMDHDHATGQFRALLCNGCNTALGMLKENPERMTGLRDYIERFQEGTK